jgi:hypothetical protein
VTSVVAFETSFIHLAASMSSTTSTLPLRRSSDATSSSRPRAADREPRARRARVALDDAGDLHRRGDLDDRADRPLPPGDLCHGGRRHAVLDAAHEPVRLEVRRDQVRRPARVVGLHEQEHDVEALAQGRHLAQVDRPHRHRHRALRHDDRDAVRAHRLDVRGPLLHEDDVLAGLDEVGADRGAVGAGADDGDPGARHRAPV